MRLENALLVFRKDWLEVRRNWQVTMPIIVVPLIFCVLLPALISFIPVTQSIPGSSLDWMLRMIENLPMNVQRDLANMTETQIMTYVMLLYFFAPFFLIIPIMASSVIASDSFAGEKERKTIEALLATPLKDSELLLGKILVSFAPSMMVTFVSFLMYTVSVDVFTFRLFDGQVEISFSGQL